MNANNIDTNVFYKRLRINGKIFERTNTLNHCKKIFAKLQAFAYRKLKLLEEKKNPREVIT